MKKHKKNASTGTTLDYLGTTSQAGTQAEWVENIPEYFASVDLKGLLNMRYRTLMRMNNLNMESMRDRLLIKLFFKDYESFLSKIDAEIKRRNIYTDQFKVDKKAFLDNIKDFFAFNSEINKISLKETPDGLFLVIDETEYKLGNIINIRDEYYETEIKLLNLMKPQYFDFDRLTNDYPELEDVMYRMFIDNYYHTSTPQPQSTTARQTK